MADNNGKQELTQDEAQRITEAEQFAAKEMPYGIIDDVHAKLGSALMGAVTRWFESNPDAQKLAEVIENQQTVIANLERWQALATQALSNALAPLDTDLTDTLHDLLIYEAAALMLQAQAGALRELDNQAATLRTSSDLWVQAANLMNNTLAGQPEGTDTALPLLDRFAAYLARISQSEGHTEA